MLTFGNSISIEEYSELRLSVGWTPLVEDQERSGLEHSDFIISCREEGHIVGCSRVFWDKGYIAYLADVIVKPEYQRQGIGSKLVTECIRFIDSQLKDGWRIKIVLVSAKGKENFYEKFGFKYRPDDTYGAGMDLWRGI